MNEAQPGDTLIRRIATGVEVVDAVSGAHIAAYATLLEALADAASRPGAVWRVSVDRHGNVFDEPILLLPRLTP